MKKLLVVGASVLQLPAIKKAKEKGYLVAAADRDPNAVGIAYADKYYQTSTTDIDGILQAATEFQADGIMTLATDMPMRAVANAAFKLGLPGILPEVALRATDKGEMIKAFKDNGVASPWFYIAADEKSLREVIDLALYPCIMKPVDNSGSRGVILLLRREQIEDSYIYSKSQSRGGGVIIEEYMQGHEVSVETMTANSTTKILAITDKLTTGPPHFVELGHSQPSLLPVEVQKQIEELALKAVEAVGIDIGPAHIEIMITEDGPMMIELGARMGGDCITTHLVPFSTGIDMVGSTIDLLTGNMTDIIPTLNMGSAIRYFKVPKGRIISIDGVEKAKGIEGVREIILMKTIGDEVRNIQSSTDRVGFVVAQGENAKQAIRICEEAMEKINITVE